MKKIGNAIKIGRRTGLIDPPSLILMSRSLSPLGKIGHYESLTLSLAADGMDEVSLDVHEYNNGKRCPVWDELTSLRLLKVGDLGVFEISVTFTDGGGSVKSIHGVSLEAELALAMLHEFHVNDDEAIEAATDYSGDTPSIESFTPTTLYNAEDPGHSLLHRVFREYAPHWRIGSVTEFVAPDTSSQPTPSSQFQRTYTADGISVYDFLTGEVAQESNVAFTFGVEEYEGRLTRTVHCHSLCDCIDQETGRLLSEGIGEDTSILISKKKLANEISVSPNTDLLKNCFHIEGGDDVITSLVRIASPGGENRIYQFSGLQYDDMTEALRQRLDRYQAMMSDASVQERYAGDGDMDAFFQGSLTLAAPSEGDVAPTAAAAAILTLCQDRNVAAADASVAHLLSNPYWRITGEGDEKRLSASKQAAGRVTDAMDALGSMGIFPRLCLAQGVLSYLTSSMMPGASPAPGTSKEQYEAVLKALTAGPIASAFLPKKTGASHSSVTNSVRAYAQAFLDARFALEVIKGSTSYERQDGAPDSGGGASTGTWKGKIRIRRRSDKGDAFPKDIQAAEPIQVHVTSDKRTLTSQKLIKELSKNSMRDIDFAAGGLNGEELRDYFRQFSLRRLEGIREGYNACLSILIELGLEKEDIYQTYHERFAIVGNENPTDKEMESQEGPGADRRQRGVLEERSAQADAVAQAMAALEDEQRQFQESHNFRAFLGEDLYKEFCNYLREDTYRNECYVSDGLSTTERLKTARELLDAASKELGKASSLQRTVSTSLNSLFALPEFEPLYEKLALYSRIRVQAGDETLSLRLIGIDLSGPSLNEIHVTFADHVEAVDGTADSLRGLLKQAGGMAASYPSTLLQAKQGQEARDIVAEMYSAGLNAAKTKLMNNENNDVTITQSGILCRHLDDEGRHSDKQFRITGNIMAFTNNNWESVSLAIGETAFPDLSGVSLGDLSNDKAGSLPMKTAYGIVAENIVGKMMMSDKLFIGNEEGTVQITGKGIVLKNGIIQSANYVEKKIGSRLDLTNGTFNFAGNGLVYDNEGLSLTGKVTATEGQIANFHIKEDRLFTDEGNPDFIGSNGIYFGNKGLRIGSKFKVTESGASFFEAEVVTKHGDIGGWSIDEYEIASKSNNGNGITLSSLNSAITSKSNDKKAVLTSGSLSIYNGPTLMCRMHSTNYSSDTSRPGAGIWCDKGSKFLTLGHDDNKDDSDYIADLIINNGLNLNGVSHPIQLLSNTYLDQNLYFNGGVCLRGAGNKLLCSGGIDIQNGLSVVNGATVKGGLTIDDGPTVVNKMTARKKLTAKNGLNATGRILLTASGKDAEGNTKPSRLVLKNDLNHGSLTCSPEGVFGLYSNKEKAYLISINKDGDIKCNITKSDRRLKTDIRQTRLDNALEQILSIGHKEFTLKRNGRHMDIGYIAQELEEINPNLVFAPEEEQPYYTVNTFYLTSLITKAIQELHHGQEKTVTELRQENARLAGRIERLEARHA